MLENFRCRDCLQYIDDITAIPYPAYAFLTRTENNKHRLWVLSRVATWFDKWLVLGVQFIRTTSSGHALYCY